MVMWSNAYMAVLQVLAKGGKDGGGSRMGSGGRDIVAKAVGYARERSGVVLAVLRAQRMVASIEADDGGEGCVERCACGVKSGWRMT
jgi:hypothetical protein